MKGNFRVTFGLLLIAAGLLFALQQLNLLPGGWDDVLFTIGSAVALVFFLNGFLSDRSQWWAALLSFIFLGLTLSRAFELFLPAAADYGGALLLFLMGVGFLSVYFLDREMWWAIIPGGVMLSLTALVLVEDLGLRIGLEPAGLLFIGMGLTFMMLYFMRVDGIRMTWAIFPAVPLLLLGLFVGLENAAAWNYVWPSLIILLGLYFVVGALRPGKE